MNNNSFHIKVGSLNKVKVKAVQDTFTSLYPPSTSILVYPFKANPNIKNWKSTKAIGQPFGSRQTAYGVLQRVLHSRKETEKKEEGKSISYSYVASENGLVTGEEIGESNNNIFSYDIVYVAYQEVSTSPLSFISICKGPFVKTECTASSGMDQKEFDHAIEQYHTIIIPKINQGMDLYKEWTSGIYTREDYTKLALQECIKEIETLKTAQTIIKECVKYGMCASAGPRYKNMLWTRDFSYMLPVYKLLGYEKEIMQALHVLGYLQVQETQPAFNGYQVYNPLGRIPIVCLPFEQNEVGFLVQRLIGSTEEEGWQLKLWNFVEENCDRSYLTSFPKERSSTSIKDLKLYYYELEQFQQTILPLSKRKQSPLPSFALQAYMKGNLDQLTPGTRDSEIHFLRAIFVGLIKPELENNSSKVHSILNHFLPYIANAFFYLYTNIIDKEDGLPKGADSRDIFADFLYDAKCLTNACLYYETLLILIKCASYLEEKTEFCDLITENYRENLILFPNCFPLLSKISTFKKSPETKTSLESILEKELQTLKHSIQMKLIGKDFLPGERASEALTNPIHVMPQNITNIIQTHNPLWITGEQIDIQGLSYLILGDNLIDFSNKNFISTLLKYFVQADSPIGFTVFVPISGKNKKEENILFQVKGRVVWPHVTWTATRALLKIALLTSSTQALYLAEETKKKLLNLPEQGSREWYAYNSETKEIYGGGCQNQGWNFSNMILTNLSFYEFYSTSSC